MKTITEMINESSVLKRRLTSDDKKNYAIIADAISEITAAISDWSEDEDEFGESDTYSLARSLSNLASKLRGEWDEEVVF